MKKKIRGICEEGKAGRVVRLDMLSHLKVKRRNKNKKAVFHFGKPTRRRIVTEDNFAQINARELIVSLPAKQTLYPEIFYAISRYPLLSIEIPTSCQLNPSLAKK
jgi:hypothetical protein